MLVATIEEVLALVVAVAVVVLAAAAEEMLAWEEDEMIGTEVGLMDLEGTGAVIDEIGIGIGIGTAIEIVLVVGRQREDEVVGREAIRPVLHVGTRALMTLEVEASAVMDTGMERAAAAARWS